MRLRPGRKAITNQTHISSVSITRLRNMSIFSLSVVAERMTPGYPFTSYQPGPSRSSKVKWSAYVRPACKIASDKLRPNLIFDQPNHWIRHLHAASNSFQHQFDGSSSSFLLRYHLDRCWEFSLCQMIWSFELRCILFRHFQATLAFWLSPPLLVTLTPQSQTPVLDIASRSLICAPRSLLVNEFPCW